MDHINVSFTLSANEPLLQVARDILASLLAEVGFHSFVDTPQGIDAYIPRDHFSAEAVERAIEAFPIDGIAITYECETIPDRDWNQAWETEGFAPIDIDGKILVYDAHQPTPTLSRPIELAIEARQAFGTATHETTRLMLSHLLALPVHDHRVLDCGCGTGILSLAASKMGAKEVVAFDIDPWSVENTRHNALLNGVGNIQVLEGDVSVLSSVGGAFDLILANINRNTLLSHLPTYRQVLAPRGTVLLSGFFTEDVPLLVHKASSLGLTKTSQSTENHWTILHFSVHPFPHNC